MLGSPTFVQRVVMLSTDKAVCPINAMGMSNALMEKLMVAKACSLALDTGTILYATRYGNVAAVSGSVISRFVTQAKAGRPITLTDQTTPAKAQNFCSMSTAWKTTF
ncbi:FlaA1/EpsC-like NDP-sugar epimerase [Bradyrhizobium sp. USDA 326]|uniref:polysaccharide biosynthesis protein n=1 Tax=Bradyrhizobium sp. USDA 326 TaxID=3377726 RepID=UPI003C73956A